jgi:hypothetical protein
MATAPVLKHPYKACQTLAGIYNTFCIESYLQIQNSDSTIAKIGVMATGAATIGGQVADRSRLPESLSIPFAISLAEEHGKLVGAGTLMLGVYAAQYVIGGAWGLGINTFNKTADVFDKSYPGYKTTLAEENAGYIKTLWRQSVIGLGIGNTAFVAAEALNDPTNDNEKMLESANRTSRRIATAAGAIGFGVLFAAEEFYDKSIGIGNYDKSVPELVDLAKKPSTWIALGLLIDLGPRLIGAGLNGMKRLFNRSEENIKAV